MPDGHGITRQSSHWKSSHFALLSNLRVKQIFPLSTADFKKLLSELSATKISAKLIKTIFQNFTLHGHFVVCLRKDLFEISDGMPPRIPAHMEKATERIGGVLYINENGIVPGHLIAGTLLKIHIGINTELIAGTTWGIVKSHSGHEQLNHSQSFDGNAGHPSISIAEAVKRFSGPGWAPSHSN